MYILALSQKHVKHAVRSLLALLLLSSCTPKPPDVPVCERLNQKLTTDKATGHVLLTPSPACMKNLNEAECGHCVWIVSGNERFIGEEHKLVPLQSLSPTGKKDAAGNAILDWLPVRDDKGKQIMVSTWLDDLKPWHQVVEESAFLPAEESYAPLATYIINACKKMKCSDEITRFKVKLDSLNGIAGAIKN